MAIDQSTASSYTVATERDIIKQEEAKQEAA
jgi:hypothetical protein